MGTPALEPANVWANGRNMTGIDRHTYWIMPLHPLVQAAWYRIVPFSLLSLRLLSMLWALVALTAWFLILRRISTHEVVPYLGTALIALDYVFIRGAAHGRMDMMGVGLTFSALAAYLCLRESHLVLALMASHALAAAAMLTHPNGILAVASLVLAALIFDRRRLRVWHAGVVAVPYLVGLGAWGLYILEAPDVFRKQFMGNAAGRLNLLAQPFQALRAEITDRYIGGGKNYLKLLMFVPCVAGLVGALTTPAIRRNRGYQLLLATATVAFVYFWLFEGTKLYLYLAYLTPMLDAILAEWLWSCWQTRPSFRIPVAVTVAVILCITAAGIAFVVTRDDYHHDFLPAINYLKTHAAPQDVIMGSAELGFELGWDRPLVDDVRLGYASGKRPQWIVFEQRYEEWTQVAEHAAPEVHSYIAKMLKDEFQQAFSENNYTIYHRTH
jgi:4-amino-4-deoxy-L-arabinose transferase-like glycosyltransferase